MRSIQVSGKTGADGVLHLSIPVGTPDAEYDVIIYLHQRLPGDGWPPGFAELFGSITDETFVRPPQCAHEKPTTGS